MVLESIGAIGSIQCYEGISKGYQNVSDKCYGDTHALKIDEWIQSLGSTDKACIGREYRLHRWVSSDR